MNPFEMERVFDVFEDAWGCPERPSIEEFLSHIDEAEKATVFRELLAIEFIKRMERGESPSCQEYEQRFAKFTAVIPEVFREVMSQVDSDQQSVGRLPKLNRFKPIDQLGRGGQGDVWLSQDPCMGRRVALKVLGSKVRENRVEFENALQLFKLESEICGKLEHPNIVPVYDISNEVTADGNLDVDAPCFVMRVFGDQRLHTAIEAFHARPRSRNEYPLLEALREFERDRTSAKRLVLEERLNQFQFDPNSDKDRELKDAIESILSGPSEAGTLSAAIKRLHSEGISDSSIRKLLSRFQRICDGIAYAHSRGVLHRDLKPANIMLGEYGETLIADWGLAKVIRRSESRAPSDLHVSPNDVVNQNAAEHELQGEVRGSLPWMSPEQANGWIDQVGIASDIYSLGAILFHILTGRAPHEGSSLSAIQQNQFAYATSINPKAPKALEAIALKAMATRPEDRYRTASDLGLDIDRWLSDEAVSAWTEPLVVRMKRWIRTHQTTAAAALATLTMATIAAIGWALISSRHANDLKTERDLTKIAKVEADSSRELAEEKAKSEQLAREKAEAEEKNAAEQKLRAQRLLVDISESNAGVALRNQDFSRALSWSVLALKQLQDTPDQKTREPIFRQRIGTILDNLPCLMHLLPLDGNVVFADIVGNPEVLVTAASQDGQLKIRTWDIATGQPKKSFIGIENLTKDIRSLSVNKDGSLLLLSYQTIDKKYKFSVFDLSSSKQVGADITAGVYLNYPMSDYQNGKFEIAQFDPSGKMILCIKRAYDSRGGALSNLETDEIQTVQVWDVNDLSKPIDEFEVGKRISGIATNRDAKVIAVTYDENKIMLWNRASKKDVVPETVHEIVKNVGVSTSIVALSEGGGRLAISSDKQVFLCDAKSSEIPPAVIQVGQFIRSTEFSPNEEHLLISSQEIAFYGKDTGALEPGFAGVWDIKDTESITQLCNPIRHDGRVTSLKWNPSLGLIISGSRDGIVQSRFEFFNNSPFPPIIHGGEVRFASLTEDGRILVTASSDGLVRIWQLDRTASNKPLGITSLESKHYLSEMSGKLPWAKPNDIQPVAQSWDDLSESYEPLARSPDDKWLVTRSRRSSQEQLNAGDRVESELFSIQLWDVTRMEKLEKVIPTELPIDRAEFSADSKMIALVSGEHPAWDPQRGDLVTTPRNSLSKPGALIVSDIDGNRISTIDPRGSIGAITFLSNGTKILVGGSDWTGKKGQISIIETKTGRVIGETIRFDSPVINLCFDSAKTKCIAHLENQSCHPFAVTTNGLKSIMEFPVAPVQRTAISGNGALAALGLINGEVYVFSITNEKTSVLVSPVWGIKEDGFLQSPIKSLHFIDEQDVILVAKENGAIEFRDAITGVVKASELVNKNIHQVFISKDNLRILVVGKDLVTQLFETTTQIPITHRIGFQKVETTDLTSCRVLPSSDFSSILIYDKDIGVNHFSQPFSRLEINEIDVLANLITLDRKTIFKSDKNVPSQADDPLKDKYGVSLNSILGFLKKNPESTMAYLIVAKAMNDAGQFENTLSSIEKFLETKSVGCDDIALELRSKAYESLGEKSLAVADQVQLAKIYVERKEVSAAVKDLTKILPNDPLIAIELLESIRSRVELDKKNNRFSGKELSVVKFDIAWIGFIANMRLGNWKEAIHESDILLTLSMYKQLIAVSSVLGIQLDAVVSRMYELSGDRKEFESRCEAMLSSVNKENGILFQEELANLCVDNPKAISDLSVLLNAMQAHRGDNRENVEFLGLLGGIEFRCGRVSDSISTLSTALELVRKVPPRNLRKITEARLMLLLALACHALGNAGDAIRWQELAEPVYQVEMKGPEKELLQLNKPTLSRLHQELHDLTSAYRRVQ